MAVGVVLVTRWMAGARLSAGPPRHTVRAPAGGRARGHGGLDSAPLLRGTRAEGLERAQPRAPPTSGRSATSPPRCGATGTGRRPTRSTGSWRPGSWPPSPSIAASPVIRSVVRGRARDTCRGDGRRAGFGVREVVALPASALPDQGRRRAVLGRTADVAAAGRRERWAETSGALAAACAAAALGAAVLHAGLRRGRRPPISDNHIVGLLRRFVPRDGQSAVLNRYVLAPTQVLPAALRRRPPRGSRRAGRRGPALGHVVIVVPRSVPPLADLHAANAVLQPRPARLARRSGSTSTTSRSIATGPTARGRAAAEPREVAPGGLRPPTSAL